MAHDDAASCRTTNAQVQLTPRDAHAELTTRIARCNAYRCRVPCPVVKDARPILSSAAGAMLQGATPTRVQDAMPIDAGCKAHSCRVQCPSPQGARPKSAGCNALASRVQCPPATSAMPKVRCRGPTTFQRNVAPAARRPQLRRPSSQRASLLLDMLAVHGKGWSRSWLARSLYSSRASYQTT